MFSLGELLNGYHHWLLARLRLPRGGLFGWVASPRDDVRPASSVGQCTYRVGLPERKSQLNHKVVSEGNAAANSHWLAPTCAVRLLGWTEN